MLDTLPLGIATLDLLAVAVDPIKPLLLDVPKRTFAEIIPGIDQQFDPQHVSSLPGQLRRLALAAGWPWRFVSEGNLVPTLELQDPACLAWRGHLQPQPLQEQACPLDLGGVAFG